MNSLTIPEANQMYVIVGGHETTGHLLDLAARLALRRPLLLFACGNRANPLPIVRELRRLTLDPLPALENIRASRAFTCYQVMALLEQAGTFPNPQPVLIFDLLATFYDESVSFAEGKRLLKRCLSCLVSLHRNAPLLISVRPPPTDFSERHMFVDMLCKIADQFWVEAPCLVWRPQQLSLFP
jgi:hypothetical protein